MGDEKVIEFSKSLWKVGIETKYTWTYYGVWQKKDNNDLNDVVNAISGIVKNLRRQGFDIIKIEIQPTEISEIWEEPKEDPRD